MYREREREYRVLLVQQTYEKRLNAQSIAESIPLLYVYRHIQRGIAENCPSISIIDRVY